MYLQLRCGQKYRNTGYTAANHSPRQVRRTHCDPHDLTLSQRRASQQPYEDRYNPDSPCDIVAPMAASELRPLILWSLISYSVGTISMVCRTCVLKPPLSLVPCGQEMIIGFRVPPKCWPSASSTGSALGRRRKRERAISSGGSGARLSGARHRSAASARRGARTRREH